jgi:hypothetical protein
VVRWLRPSVGAHCALLAGSLIAYQLAPSRSVIAVVMALGTGLLAMLADTLPPEASKVEGVLTGPLVVVGFAISLALSAIE